MWKKALIIGVVCMAVAVVAINTELNPPYIHHEGTWWSGLKSALADMNPFGSRLGHDWQQTQNRVEDIYRDAHLEAQRRVDSLTEDTYKTQGELQEKIAEIYLEAAVDAEKRIEKMKNGLLASLWRSRYQEDEDIDSSNLKDTAKGYYDKAKGAVEDAAHSVKRRLYPHEQHTIFDETSKKVSDAYRQAVIKAKESTKSLPTAGEAWHETKRKAREAYDSVMEATHRDTRSKFRKMMDKLGSGFHMAHTVEKAAWKTWHIVLHLFLATFWMIVGGIGVTLFSNWANKATFRKQLNANVQGPVVMSKEFMVIGTEDTQRKFNDYWANTAAGFFQRQPGLRKFSLQRGFNVGSNVWQHLSEWNGIEDLRRAMNQPEFNELKKRMPKSVLSKYQLSQVVTTGKGMNIGTQGQEDIRSEGLRQRMGQGIST
jgi:hypothetical protein